LHFNPDTETLFPLSKNWENPEKILPEICKIYNDDELWDIILNYNTQIKNQININHLMENAIDYYVSKGRN
jgi:hypothetical protein